MMKVNKKLPPCINKCITINKNHYKKSKSTDGLLSPLALAIKPLLKKDCDVIVTTKQVLFYSCPFDRKNLEVVLGLGREAIINIPVEIIKILKNYENEKIIEEVEFKFPIPIIVLDN